MLFVKKNKIFTKVFILLLLLIVACGGSSEETTLTDSTTTTIPPAPTADFNIIEIYNINLGSESELCNDVKEIDTASQECLRQYKDNLETVISYAENLQTYVTELNTYLNTYPSAMTEDYTALFEFISSEYQSVTDTFILVRNKYSERFGGVPMLNEILRKSNIVEPGCRLSSNFVASENTKKMTLIYVNEFFDELKIDTTKFNEDLPLTINEFSGTYVLNEIIATNYLDEEFAIEFEDIIIVENVFPRITSIEIINGKPDLSKEELVTIRFDVLDGNYFKLEDINYIFVGLYNAETNRSLDLISLEDYGYGGEVNMLESFIDLNILFSDERSDRRYENYSVLPVGPYENEYYIGFASIGINNQYNLLLSHNVNKLKKYVDYPSACGNTNSIKAPEVINNQVTVTPEK
jgi:hypothetical protein